MKTTLKKSTLFALAIILSALGSWAQEVSKTFSGIKKINLSTSSGDVKLVKGSSNSVEVKVSFSYTPSDYQPILEQNGSTLILKEDFGDKRSHSGTSKWVLTLPDGLEVKTSSGSGDFEAADLKVSITANTGSGDYTWTNISGDAGINTGSGNITLDNYKGKINLNTGSGDIGINNADGDMQANAGSGNIQLGLIKGAVNANTGSGNIKAKEINLTGKGSFNSGSGDVLLVLTSPITYNLSLNSGSGDAVLDCKGTKLEGKLVMTANKRNGTIKAPFAFDKTEEINDHGDDNTRVRKTVQLGSSDVEIKIGSGSGTAEVRK